MSCRRSVHNSLWRSVKKYFICTDVHKMSQDEERISNGHSFSILHMEGIAGELKRAGITQNEMKSGEGYSK